MPTVKMCVDNSQLLTQMINILHNVIFMMTLDDLTTETLDYHSKHFLALLLQIYTLDTLFYFPTA